MRNTDSGGNTSWMVALSAARDARSWPNGFSTTTRRQLASSGSVSPCSLSWPITSGKYFGGIER